jgi:hypothetical protein
MISGTTPLEGIYTSKSWSAGSNFDAQVHAVMA